MCSISFNSIRDFCQTRYMKYIIQSHLDLSSNSICVAYHSIQFSTFVKLDIWSISFNLISIRHLVLVSFSSCLIFDFNLVKSRLRLVFVSRSQKSLHAFDSSSFNSRLDFIVSQKLNLVKRDYCHDVKSNVKSNDWSNLITYER